MKDKTTYVQEVEDQLDKWGKDIYKFKIIAEEEGWEDPDRQVKYYQIIEDISNQKKKIAEKLTALKEEDSNWQQYIDEIDSLRKIVSNGITSAYTIVT